MTQEYSEQLTCYFDLARHRRVSCQQVVALNLFIFIVVALLFPLLSIPLERFFIIPIAIFVIPTAIFVGC